MPVLPNKVLINQGRDKGNAAAINGYNECIDRHNEVLSSLGWEAKELGLLKETAPIRDKMQVGCDEYNRAQANFARAQRKYIAMQNDCINAAQKLIDDHILSQP